jgi:hypothetical protein
VFGEGWQARELGEWDVECIYIISRFCAKFIGSVFTSMNFDKLNVNNNLKIFGVTASEMGV